MAFNFAKAKANMRKVVHSTLSVQAFYKDKNMSEPVEVRVRWHTNANSQGALEVGNGYAEVLEDIDMLIFDESVARSIPVISNGTVWIASPDGNEVSLASQLNGPHDGAIAFKLVNRMPKDGAVSEVWEVTRK